MATRASRADAVRAAGFEVWPFAEAPAEDERNAIFGSVRGLSNDEANIRVGSEIFANLDARAALPGVLDACAAWRPHVIVPRSRSSRAGWPARTSTSRS